MEHMTKMFAMRLTIVKLSGFIELSRLIMGEDCSRGGLGIKKLLEQESDKARTRMKNSPLI